MMNIINFPNMDELKFCEKNHIYELDGIKIPSVTTIMQPLSQAKYNGISDETLHIAAQKGTAVHNAIENYLNFEIIDVPSEYMPYFEAFMSWFNKTHPEIIKTETKVYHKILLYAGTVDLICEIDGKLTLVDYKTTYTLSEMLCGVQLEAYSKALESHQIKVQQKMILHLKKDGTFDTEFFDVNDSTRWRVFGSLKCVYDYIQSAK